MADKYLDHGVYGSYSATPTWGNAQDGDGTASGTATPATASIVFTGVPSSGTITVCGVTLSPTWATDANTCANNLATSINASTSNVTLAGWNSNVQLRNAVYARGPANGAATGTCEIMTRQGSAAHNGTNAFVWTLNNVSGTSPATFSGGAGGAWGYACNDAGTIWASAVAQYNYGVLSYSTTIYCGSITDGDNVYIRTKRSGSNITVSFGSQSYFPRFKGSTTEGLFNTYIADAGVKWNADAGVFTLQNTVGDWNRIYLGHQSLDRIRLVGSTVSGTTKNFVITHTQQYGLYYVWCSPNVHFYHIEFKDQTNAGYENTFQFDMQTTNGGGYYYPIGYRALMKSCTFRRRTANIGGLFSLAQYGSWYGVFDDCDFVGENQTIAQNDQIIGVSNYCNYTGGHLEFRNCRGSGWPTGSGITGDYSTQKIWLSQNNFPLTLSFHNCDFGNATLCDPKLIRDDGTAVNVSGIQNIELQSRRLLITSTLPGRRFFYQNCHYELEWSPTASWPRLNAQLPESYGVGDTSWVYRLRTTTNANAISKNNPMPMVRMTKFNDVGQQVMLCTLNLLIDNLIDTGGSPVQKSEVILQVEYVDKDGTPRLERSFNYGDTDGNLATSTASWTTTSYDINAVQHNYNKRKIELTTAYQVKANSEMFFTVSIGRRSTTTDEWYFIDPEILLS